MAEVSSHGVLDGKHYRCPLVRVTTLGRWVAKIGSGFTRSFRDRCTVPAKN